MSSTAGGRSRRRGKAGRNKPSFHFPRVERMAGVCSNPFGCRVGANPWHVTIDLSIGRCVACHHRQEEQPFVFPFGRFRERLECCPMCFWLFGERPKGASDCCCSGQLKEVDCATELLGMDRFKDKDKFESNSCWMCGFSPARVLEFLEKAPTKEGDCACLTNDLMQIVRVARGDRDIRDLANELREHSRSCRPNDAIPRLRQCLRELTGSGAYTSVQFFERFDEAVELI